MIVRTNPALDQSDRPALLPVKPDGIPNELTTLPQWVLWRLEKRDRRWTKVPYQPNGRKAQTSNSATWVSFAEALAAHGRGFDGIGFVFTRSAGLVGIDLDKCRDPQTGVVEPWAADLVQRFTTYTELSPTGTGIKLFCRGGLPIDGKRKGQIEVYAAGRFFTVTGHVWGPRS